jgi:hypothetical protein
VGTHKSVSRHAGDVVGSSFFLGAVDPFNSINDFIKGCDVRGLPVGSVRVTYVDWRGKHTCRVYQVSLARCTLIPFVVTLEYE